MRVYVRVCHPDACDARSCVYLLHVGVLRMPGPPHCCCPVRVAGTGWCNLCWTQLLLLPRMAVQGGRAWDRGTPKAERAGTWRLNMATQHCCCSSWGGPTSGAECWGDSSTRNSCARPSRRCCRRGMRMDVPPCTWWRPVPHSTSSTPTAIPPNCWRCCCWHMGAPPRHRPPLLGTALCMWPPCTGVSPSSGPCCGSKRTPRTTSPRSCGPSTCAGGTPTRTWKF